MSRCANRGVSTQRSLRAIQNLNNRETLASRRRMPALTANGDSVHQATGQGSPTIQAASFAAAPVNDV
jgi:hypothetical protein